AAYKTAAGGESAAFEAVAIGQPGAALAALLRAHELRPEEPRYLVAAASLLTSTGHPREALALINGADALMPTRSAPFGISQQAIELNAKGAALLALAQYDDAERYLGAAIAIEPLLAEAKLNLLVVLLCRQNTTDGMRFLRAGLARQATINPDGSVSLPPLQDTLDLTHGTQATLSPFPIPDTWQGMAAAVPMFTAMSDAQYARLVARGRRDTDLRNQVFAEKHSLLTQARELEILGYETDGTKAVVEKYARMGSDAHGQVLTLMQSLNTNKWQSDAGTACASLQTKNPPAFEACRIQKYNEYCAPELDRVQAQVVDIAKKLDQADRDAIAQWYPWASAVIANIGDPAAHERYLTWLEETVDGAYYNPLDF